MDIPQVYVFSGPGFNQRANEFLRDRSRGDMSDIEIVATEKYIAITAKIRWSMCEEVWRIYLTHSTK